MNIVGTKISEDVWLELILNDLKGELGVIEKLKLDNWIDASLENKTYYEDIKEIWYTISILKDSQEVDVEKAILNFKQRVAESNKPRISLSKILKYVAVLVLFILSSYFFSTFSFVETNEELALNSIMVPEGSTSKVEMRDGTRIWINSNSELELVKKHSANERRIRLNGEAFLEVNRNEEYPFTVETTSGDIKVLGTTFNVNAYSSDKVLKVTLESGSIDVVTTANHKVRLIPGEQLVYDSQKMEYTINVVNLKRELIWKTNNLIFTGEAFDEIIELLEKKFKVRIQIDNSDILKSRFSGDFVKKENLEEILDVMSTKNRFKYEFYQKDNLIIIY